MVIGFDLDLLRTFVAVVDAGGFTKAAGRVHLTQSTISQQIKKLENNLGHLLLIRDRATGGVRTTEPGELLLGYARRILSISMEANEALGAPNLTQRTVRLGVPEDFAGRPMIDLLSGFARQFPTTRLDTVSGWSFELRKLLEMGDLDLALIKREKGDGPCIAKWDEELLWVGNNRFPSPSDPVPLVVFPAGCVYRDRAISAIERSGRHWRIAYTSQGLMGVQAAVSSGLGISLLPADAVLTDHRQLGQAEGFDAEPCSELALISLGRTMEPAVKMLAEFLVSSIDGLRRVQAAA
ncbi:LysR substrate-binding domain-containing protein [Rhizobium sp. Root1220]|uniref:LysR substrate-binding domain-containing protein n=1 Tax=Rhizobium sp. Root1220 TaxID=1736432 RepID=UPI0006F25779|nr:LysR substrate-binding domain-containing protein [Rhizobium sp. Root1220]KQV70365.1 LysR family transcriptional regulator [Rhizobium sp. Root1220]